ncbi:MAG: DUF742 domain-containing protein [Actinoallomurus sp.]
MKAARWARPYLLTGGRTFTRQMLYTHTLVSAPYWDPARACGLIPEARALYERAARSTESIAELSAYCDIPLGITRVLIADLAAAGDLVISPETYPFAQDPDLLERLLDGLVKL